MDREELEEGFSSQNVSISVSSIRESPVGYKYLLSDGTSFFIISSHFYNRNIQSGMDLSSEDIEYLEAEDLFYHGFRQALRYLEIRDHSSRELVLKLRKKGHSQDTAIKVCNDLKEKNYLNDYNFAENYLLSLIQKKRFSRLILTRKLSEKGIDRETCEELLARHYSEAETEEAVCKAIDKALPKPGMTREKLIQSLLRKGFRYHDISGAVEEKMQKFNNE
jgi:regulatory protein